MKVPLSLAERLYIPLLVLFFPITFPTIVLWQHRDEVVSAIREIPDALEACVKGYF